MTPTATLASTTTSTPTTSPTPTTTPTTTPPQAPAPNQVRRPVAARSPALTPGHGAAARPTPAQAAAWGDDPAPPKLEGTVSVVYKLTFNGRSIHSQDYRALVTLSQGLTAAGTSWTIWDRMRVCGQFIAPKEEPQLEIDLT